MPNKILIIGCCGSGKSTLAKKVQVRTGLPLIHLDKEYHKPNWERPQKAEWQQKVAELCAQDKWIMDGNYISSMPVRMEKADTVIFLDMNRVKCLTRAIYRVFQTSKRHRSDMAEGCNERHDMEFYQFIWNFHKTTRPRIYQLLEEHKELIIFILKRNRDIKTYLDTLNQ